MKKIFLLLCCGEVAFLLENISAAISLFSLCQILLILRNGKGLKIRLADASAQIIRKLRLLALILGIFMVLIINSFYPLMGNNSLLFIVGLYGILLSVSLWVGLASYLLCLFPRINSQMIALGMVCFFCCDLLVGIEMVTKGSYLSLIANSTVWIFYTPALVFLALSCYKWGQAFQIQ